MNKQITTLAMLLFLSLSAWAQKEYKIAKKTDKLHLHLNGAVIEGYDGKEIVFSGQKETNAEEDERAKGLTAISSSGLSDNTGLGINVTDNGQEIKVSLVGNGLDNDVVKILVPKQMNISFTYEKSLYNEPVIIKNIKGEIEISVRYNKVNLENNSGPMNIKTIYGSIDASFTEPIKGPVSIISVYDYVDIAIPRSTKANIELGTSYGKLYAADDFEITRTATAQEKDEHAGGNKTISVFGHGATSKTTKNKKSVTVVNGSVMSNDSSISAVIIPGLQGHLNELQENLKSISISPNFSFGHAGDRENIKGTINGGGVDLIFKSNYKNVYLRTAK